MKKRLLGTKAFSLIELLVVIAIIGLLVAVVVVSISQAKGKGRDAEVRSDVQRIKLALVRAREANTNFIYPGTASSWACLKTTGTCWNGAYSGNPTLITSVSSYFPGGTVPQPTGTRVGEFRHDAYAYNAGPVVPSVGSPSGSYLIWAQEKTIPNSDCPGWNAGRLSDGFYYCYELLPR